MTSSRIATIIAAAALSSVAAIPQAQALTAQECSAKYQAAKTAGTLNGQGWNDFRKAQCGGSDAAAAPAATDKSAEAKPEAKPEAKSEAKKEAKPKATETAAPSGPATYPSAVDAKFAKEPAARARLHTCAEQWKANKAANTTGGMKWIEKGGGYWSECNKRLKG